MSDSSRDDGGAPRKAPGAEPAAGWGRGTSLSIGAVQKGPSVARVAVPPPPALTAAVPSAAPLTLRPAAPVVAAPSAGGILGGSVLPGGPARSAGLIFAGPAAFATGTGGRPAAPASAPASRYRATPAASPLSPPPAASPLGSGPAGPRRGPQGS
ncbi:MAG: hypothetical protein QE280_00675 [Caulobacter sp.]|nr:hypothetical protein [Caulobacter sp.]